MDRIALSTTFFAPREAVFEALVDFPRYPRYTEYLERVTTDGDGGPGTRYQLEFSWWKLSYTVHSEVTAVEAPDRVDWRITRHLDAQGSWTTESVDLPSDAPDDAAAATRVDFEAQFDPHSARTDAVSLPRFVSLDRVIEMVRPKIVEEAERVVERAVADVEGRRRDVEIAYHDRPDSV
ncbi:MAG: SRPBCC family protein [Haloferacaceae archaeon]